MLVLPSFLRYVKQHPPSYPADGNYGTVNIVDFSDSVFVLHDNNTQTRRFIDRYLEQYNFHPMIVFESSSTSIVRNMIREGNGIGFLPRYFVQDFPDVTVYNLEGEFYHSHGFLASKKHPLTDTQKILIQLISLTGKTKS